MSNIKSNTWPFLEAERILTTLEGKLPNKGYVLFETGYGPSGLPHIGTFGEIARTNMVRNAFSQISDLPTKMFCISDDMDGMRKIPQNVPNHEMCAQYLGQPLSQVPDPFNKATSFAAGMNGRMQQFLDDFQVDHHFISATELYKNGSFNQGLIKVMQNYDAIMDIMLPTLGEERRATYSPFLPICPKTGKVLQVPAESIDAINNTMTYKDPETHELCTVSILDGNCKLQWKVDFAMKWTVFEVDFEMYGKDHHHNAEVYSAICKALGGTPPVQMFYEMFLGQFGGKVSKSKGNNSIDMKEWLSYAPREVLTYFMYTSPKRAKKMHKDVVPKAADEYLKYLSNYTEETRYDNPAYHVHYGKISELTEHAKQFISEINYSLLLNLINACHATDVDVIMNYITKEKAIPDSIIPLYEKLISGAIHYYNDYIKAEINFKHPNEDEIQMLKKLQDALASAQSATSSELQTIVFSIAKEDNVPPKQWFSTLYNTLFGSEHGPRMGTFIHLYGVDETISLIEQKIKESL